METNTLAPANAQESVATNAEVEAPAAAVNETESQATEANEAPDAVETPFPKKAVNALSRRDKQIARLRAEVDMLRKYAPQPQVQQQPTNNTPNQQAQGAPREEDFDNYGDYLKATIMHEIKDQLPKNNQPTPEQLKQAQWVQERETSVAQKASEYIKVTPEFAEMVEEYGDVLDNASPAVERLFLELDDAPAAFYALAKEGMLERVAQMSPQMAASYLTQAEIRGKQMLQQKKTSGAPKPLSAARGTSKSTRDIASMDAKDLMKHWNL